MLVHLDESHRELIYRIRAHAEEWLADKDTDQYQQGVDPAVVRKNLDRQITSGRFYGWQTDDGRIVAIAALTEPDAELWTPEEAAEPQLYIGRLYVAEDEHGKGHGSAMLDAIADKAQAEDKRWVRLNCWSTNARLHNYYHANGFEHVRTADIPGRMSGALFQQAISSAARTSTDQQPAGP